MARFYPVPESRKSSDVDLLLADRKDLKRAEQVLEAAGYVCLDPHKANHHQAWATPDNHLLELHVLLVEPMHDKRLNQYIKELYTLDKSEIKREKVLGVELPVLPDGRLIFHLLLHMLQDFLGSGFGLKLLCDWIVFWDRKVDTTTVEEFLEYVRISGLSKFLSAVTSVCVRFLGLSADGSGTFLQKEGTFFYEKGVFCQILSEEVAVEFMQEILDAERFGRPETERMVSMQGTGLVSYVREFHHQTVLSFPRVSRMVFPLPVLYIIVLIRFLRNNKKIRGGESAVAILKSADQRSRLAKKIL